MVDIISDLAMSKLGDVSSWITDLSIVPKTPQHIKWTIEDNCRICAIIQEEYTVKMTIKGGHELSYDGCSPDIKLRCFDYEELGKIPVTGEQARRVCGICPCEKK